MTNPDDHRHEQQSATFVALLLFSLILILFQVWLCFGVAENLLAGKPAMAVPAAIASILAFAVHIWMYVGILRVDRGL